jgi:hypothetical protein
VIYFPTSCASSWPTFNWYLFFHEHRLEGKAANLEAENQMLRQQGIPTPPSTAKSQSAYSKISMIHVIYFK